MKHKIKVPGILWILLLCAIAFCFYWRCSVPYVSASAVMDLQEELENIYGMEYSAKPVPGGTEDMVFEIQPKTRFMTNSNLRNALGLDYEYECRVIITTYTSDSTKTVHTITYQAFDPMGADRLTDRAALDLGSKTETME